MFDHVSIQVSDIERSREFYEKTLAVLGHKIVFEESGVVVGFGTHTHNMFEIVQEDSPFLPTTHIAFIANNKERVYEFYQKALGLGGKDNGAPGLRPEYEEHYFAAFVLDLDGYNIEVVYSGK